MNVARSGIYEIVNRHNGKRYIGSSRDITKRWKLHQHLLGRGTHHSPHLQHSWNKYGIGAFAFVVRILCPQAELQSQEQAAIDQDRPEYNVLHKAYSMSGNKLSPDQKAFLSKRMRGNTIWVGRKHSPETIERMSRAKMGRAAVNKGTKRSAELVEKTAAAHRGMKRSLVTRARISVAMTGKKYPHRPAEWCAKLSASQRGRRNSAESIAKMRATKQGTHLSPEHRAAIGLASKAAWAKRKAAA